MSQRFDLYSARADEVFQPGEVVTLDGLDGFHDQYIDAATPGDAIRFPGLKRLGEQFSPSASKPPLSPERYRHLRLSSRVRWKRLPVPFDHVREIT
jgi:hypothetical protein